MTSRAGPITGPARRMDSNIADRRSVHGWFGMNSERVDVVVLDKVVLRWSCSPSVLMMSLIVAIKVDCKFVRPTQTTIAMISIQGN